MAFKVGDRVRWTANPEFGVGTVLDPDYNPDGWIAAVRFDDYKYNDPAEEGGYHAAKIEHLELVDESDNVGDDHDTPSVLSAWAREVLAALGKVETVKDATEAALEDDVNHPAHYNSGKIEVWDFIYDQGLGYALGNATKYIARCGKKAGNSKVKDLRKAIAFLEREIRFEETGE